MSQKSISGSSGFDFDEWLLLANNSPEEFEQRRRTAVASVIFKEESLVRMLQGMQCRIDLERIRARTPLKACLRIYSMMWDSFFDLNDYVNAPSPEKPMPAVMSSLLGQSATIIPFPQAAAKEVSPLHDPLHPKE